eukprot:COSAG01_NODE_6345_length_3723_cov_13.346302_2_plen_194_part_00
MVCFAMPVRTLISRSRYGLSEGGGAASADGGCVICLDGPKDTAVLPCRHLCVCSTCARALDRCPLCRGGVSATMQMEGLAPPPSGGAVSRPFPSWNRSISTEIDLCHACSCHEILRTEAARQGGTTSSGGAEPSRSGSGRSAGAVGGAGGRAAAAAASLAGQPLPYGGDMQAAMKAGDRDAIRTLMAARDSKH